MLKWALDRAKEDSQVMIFIFFLFSGIAVAVAFGVESFAFASPCSLCIAQRYIHGFILLSAGIGLLQKLDESSCIRTCQILLLMSFAVALLHSLIQMGLITDFCAISRHVHDIDAFKELLLAPLSCRDHALRFFKLPLPVLNAVGSMSLFLAFLRKKKV